MVDILPYMQCFCCLMSMMFIVPLTACKSAVVGYLPRRTQVVYDEYEIQTLIFSCITHSTVSHTGLNNVSTRKSKRFEHIFVTWALKISVLCLSFCGCCNNENDKQFEIDKHCFLWVVHLLMLRNVNQVDPSEKDFSYALLNLKHDKTEKHFAILREIPA